VALAEIAFLSGCGRGASIVPDSFAGNPALFTPEPWSKREQWQSEVPILWGFSAIAARD
jgi:hypothetical protein